MEAIGLNPIRLDAIGIDPIRLNAIRLGVPGASSGSVRPYIAPEVLASLVAVVKCDGKSNNDPDRAIIKNLVDPDNPFVISNAAYKLNSGFGKYEEDFTNWKSASNINLSSDGTKISTINTNFSCQYNYSSIGRDVPSFKVKISNFTEGTISYYYREEDGNEKHINFGPITVANSNGIIELPKSYNTVENGIGYRGGFIGIQNTNIGLTIEQIPSFQGALVTDGVNDMITSTKTMSEMLGGGNKCTVISFITHISGAGKYNFIGNSRIQVSDYAGQSFMAGCSSKSGEKIVELGDKEKIQAFQYTTFDSKLSIGSLETGLEISSYAYYGTFVFNKDSVPIDWIHQVIAYFYLDKYVTADIIYDTIRQGITNENHASFNDELVDFSGNGHNLKIYNSAWNKESGINDEGAWQTDGVSDYGQYVGDLGLKDYTVAVDRTYPSLKGNGVPIISGIKSDTATPFLFEFADNTGVVRPYSFGATTVLSPMELNRKISYQSTYIYDGTTIIKGIQSNAGSGLTIGRFGEDRQYANIALWSLLLFPYSLSEFLLERQLKRYKLGTLYPDMVEFRPIVKSNSEYQVIDYYIDNLPAVVGKYYPIDSNLRIAVVTKGVVDEVSCLIINGVSFGTPNVVNNRFTFNGTLSSKSPQKIDITIDEYIRYEDIVQPYPFIFPIVDTNNKIYSWGDKIKVGTEIKFAYGSNLLPQLYELRGEVMFNGNTFDESSKHIIGKTNIFTLTEAPKYLKDNEPNCILAPQTLRIPNSSYKILGYIPDLTGKGNHGKINNSAYADGSGVNENGSYQLDGVDDFITIPNLSHGAKQVLMKVNYKLQNSSCAIYDQRTPTGIDGGWVPTFCIYSNGQKIAYVDGNNGNTYIDGILNTSIEGRQLANITHNITITNENTKFGNTQSPVIGKLHVPNSAYAQMALFTFMSFDEISSEDEIKELNDIVGIEGGYVESPDYYWDAYGKSNTQADDIDDDIRNISNSKMSIFDKSITGLSAIEQTNADGKVGRIYDRALTANNFAYNEESGYGGWLGVEDLTTALNYRGDTTTNNWKRGGTFLKDRNRNDGPGCGYAFASWFDKANYILKFKVKITGLTDADELYICQYNTIDPEIKQQLFNGINEVSLDLSASINPTYQYISFKYPPLTNDVDFEFLYEYQNGLVSDSVDDNLKNASMPVLTDYTWIMKRKRLNNANSVMAYKGDAQSMGAFMFELLENAQYTRSFSASSNTVEFSELISYQTKTNYNGKNINAGIEPDGNTLYIFRSRDAFPYYCKAVFYKAMLYSKTIDILSINMLKNLFERDELIDVNNPIFKKEEL